VKGDGSTALEPHPRLARVVLAGPAHSSPAAARLGAGVFCYQGTFFWKSLGLGHFAPLLSRSGSGVQHRAVSLVLSRERAGHL